MGIINFNKEYGHPAGRVFTSFEDINGKLWLRTLSEGIFVNNEGLYFFNGDELSSGLLFPSRQNLKAMVWYFEGHT